MKQSTQYLEGGREGEKEARKERRKNGRMVDFIDPVRKIKPPRSQTYKIIKQTQTKVKYKVNKSSKRKITLISFTIN